MEDFMNKRIILLFFAFICVICCAFGLSACGKEAHTHLYVESVVSPTCTEQGYSLHICSCGDSYKDSYIDSLGHDLVHHDEQAPTCSGIGWNEYDTCSRCNYTIFAEIPALLHTPATAVEENRVEATCTIDGHYDSVVYCSVCQAEISREEQCLAQLGHAIKSHVAKAPTCTEIGWNAYDTCSRCDYTTYVELPALGHDYVNKICSLCGEKEPSKGLEYSLNNTYYSVSGLGTCTDTEINIPAIYNGLPVKAIANSAFANCTGLTNVIVPNSVTNIGDSAFSGCTGLTSVVISDYVTTIGLNAFSNCTGLTSVTIGSGVTSIGKSAFEGCTRLTKINYNAERAKLVVYNCVFKNAGIDGEGITVNIGANVRLIPNHIFSRAKNAATGNPKIINVIFAEGSVCETIEDSAFCHCTELKSITIPDSVKSIKMNAFFDCMGLTSITIGNGVTSIGEYAFYGCEGATNITIGNSVTNIDEYAFAGCTSLTSITIPNSVTTIGNYVFNACNNVTSLSIGTGLTTISEYAFFGCTGLTELNIGGNITTIGRYAFSDCTGITSITIGDNVTTIAACAFENCNGLISLTIGKGVTSIGGDAFYKCDNVNFKTVNITNLVAWCNISFGGACANPLYYGAGLYCNGKLVTKLTEENLQGATKIGCHAFFYYNYLTSVSIPNSVTSIEHRAFYNCCNLTSVTIGDSVTSIGIYAFVECEKLTSVTIGANVTSIGYEAFKSCSNIESITFKNTSGWWVSTSATATSGTDISSDDLILNAVTYLTNTYTKYYWKRS